jgi:predicted phage tail protein
MKTLIILALSFGLVLPVAAQTNVSGTRSRDIQVDAQLKIKAAREEFQKSIQTTREEMQRALEVQRDALRVKLQGVKDARKKAAVERIDRNLGNLNARMTAHYANVLDQIDAVLVRIVGRTDKAQQDGKDVVSVRAAITSAQGAIAAARAAVTAQTGKTYALNITAEASLRSDVGVARKALHDDLMKTLALVKDAREAVRKVAVALAQVPGEKGSGPTSTPTTTNQ